MNSDEFIQVWIDFQEDPKMEFENSELASEISNGILQSVALYFYKRGREFQSD